MNKVKEYKRGFTQSNRAGKFAYNTALNLYIDYDNGKLIELYGKKYYTFPMFRRSEENLENILFIQNENGSVDLYFVKYDVKPEDLKDLTNDEKNNISIQLHRQTGDLICFDIINRFLQYPEGCTETHSNGYTCTPEVVTEITTFCDWVSAGGGVSSGSNSSGSTSGGGGGSNGSSATNETIPPIITSIIGLTPTQINFKDFITGLGGEQLEWWENDDNQDIKEDIEHYIKVNTTENGINSSALLLASQIIQEMALNPELNLDIYASSKSPAFVDISSIDNSTPEGQKFNFIYNKLLDVPQFKELFTNIFGGNQTRFNVKFEIPEHVFSETNPTQEINGKAEWNGNNNITISISKQILLSDNITMKLNNLEIAKVIVHECVHAYLMIKATNPNYIPTINGAQNMNLEELINAIYTSETIQHDFMYNHFVPTIKNIVSQLLNSLTTEPKRQSCEELVIRPYNITNPSITTN